MEKIYEKTLLYDFYGELLTDRQKTIYEEVVFNDMSLSEAASEYGISRQGVHDMLKRCDEALEAYEEKLHMVRQFEKIRHIAEQLSRDAVDKRLTKKELCDSVSASAEAILKEIQ